jgi:superfamily II DNA or RNA helicase
MPTGTGKTITFLSAAKAKNLKCLILVHRQELLSQTVEKAILCGYSEGEVSTITSEKKQQLNKLTIAMVPTLIRNLDTYEPEQVEMIIIDEAHHATADSYRKILNHFKVFEEKKILLGFTATPLRGDKKQLSEIFSSHSFKMTLSEATQQGYICPVHGIRIDIQRSLSEVDQMNGDYDIKQLDGIMNCDSINDLIVDKCEFLYRTPSIVFCTSVDHAKKIAKRLRDKKRKAISVSYLTPKKTLEKIFTRLKAGKIEFITNAVKLSEGFDFPPIQSIILCRPTRSPVLYKQMIGRGLRKSKDKYDCLVMEFSGNDEKMICWEDIDQNCTFQSTSVNETKSRKEAISFYKDLFKSPDIIICDVRISSFKFYECKIVRKIKYKNFRYVPFEDGFILGDIRRSPNSSHGGDGHIMEVFMCLWSIKYKSFYLWDSGGSLQQFDRNKGPDSKARAPGYTHEKLDQDFMKFCSLQPDPGKWYPSEEEPINKKQIEILKTNERTSCRKAEFLIEDRAIKRCIQNHFIDCKMPSFDGEDFMAGRIEKKIDSI